MASHYKVYSQISEAYSEACQTSNTVAKNSILDVWQGSE